MKLQNKDERGGALTRSLGWFSIGLGVAQIVAPRALSKLIGVEERPALMRILGIREAVSGIGILAQHRPAPWLWSRVAGDGMDLALLGFALASRESTKGKVLATTVAVSGVTAVDIATSVRHTRGIRHIATSVITVNRSQADAYAFWTEAGNLKQFVRSIPRPMDFEIVEARPHEFVEWRSRDGIAVTSATTRFNPAEGRNGTEVRVEVQGLIPRKLLHEDARRFKRLLETGEIPTSEGQPAGPSAAAPLARLIHRVEGKEIA